MRILRSLRARYTLFHQHHGKHVAHIGRLGIFGEISYHTAEIMGAHSGVLVAAGILITIQAIRVLTGNLE